MKLNQDNRKKRLILDGEMTVKNADGLRNYLLESFKLADLGEINFEAVMTIDLPVTSDLISLPLADSVHDVVGIKNDHVSPPLDTGDQCRTEYIKGIGKYGDDFILLLDIQEVVTDQEMVTAIP